MTSYKSIKTDVIKGPLITEKLDQAREKFRQYSFIVDKKATKKPAKAIKGFTNEEKAAAKARIQELKAEARANKDKAEGENAVLAAITMPIAIGLVS